MDKCFTALVCVAVVAASVGVVVGAVFFKSNIVKTNGDDNDAPTGEIVTAFCDSKYKRLATYFAGMGIKQLKSLTCAQFAENAQCASQHISLMEEFMREHAYLFLPSYTQCCGKVVSVGSGVETLADGSVFSHCQGLPLQSQSGDELLQSVTGAGKCKPEDIQHLDLRGCEITDDMLPIIAELCKSYTTACRVLDLRDNPIGDSGSENTHIVLESLKSIINGDCKVLIAGNPLVDMKYKDTFWAKLTEWEHTHLVWIPAPTLYGSAIHGGGPDEIRRAGGSPTPL
jgi:hypothetical protein